MRNLSVNPDQLSIPLNDHDTESHQREMRWEDLYTFSPIPRSIPLHRSHEPSPEVNDIAAMEFQEPFLEDTTAATATTKAKTTSTKSDGPISFAFQRHAMQPCFPFRGRSRSIFMATDAYPTTTNAYRRVSDFLRNSSIQSIHTWFRETIESKALEHSRNLSLMDSLAALHGTTTCEEPGGCVISDGGRSGDCPICCQSGSMTVMKAIANCGHKLCWKCEQDLNRSGNIACPLCRGIRLITTFESSVDMFKTTIGLLPRDYTHPLCQDTQTNSTSSLSLLRAPIVTSHNQDELLMSGGDVYQNDPSFEAENLLVVEHELSDRYLWEQSATFLEYLQFGSSSHASSIVDSSSFSPIHQYYQLNAVKDLCFRPLSDRNLPEYNDHALIEPPTSGLSLPPSRLFLTMIHFCLDMLTIPNPAEFQTRIEFKKEYMVLELVILFLVPTDQYSPRKSDRIHDSAAWIEHGQWVLARVYRFLRGKARVNKREVEVGGGGSHIETGSGLPRRRDESVPSSPISRLILFLGVERWIWIAQSLTNMIGWIQIANANPLMPVGSSLRSQTCSGSSSSGIHGGRRGEKSSSRPRKKRDVGTRPEVDENPRPVKRARFRRRIILS
ncbi:hypothetical protein BGZ83_007221 [Gryganskiella cystojenkinii]|nr:hypothetical protein BGZ83_007221 [Gryganskiella cystojenkinii]